MAGSTHKGPLTGHPEFDSLMAGYADEPDVDKAEAIRQQIWDQFGSDGAVFISDMASFSSTSWSVLYWPVAVFFGLAAGGGVAGSELAKPNSKDSGALWLTPPELFRT